MGAGRGVVGRRWGVGFRGAAGAVLACALLASAAAAKPPAVVSALSHGHAYRHGVVPPRGQQNRSTTLSSSGGNLAYGGGISGVGVTTGAPKVYLVFWGSQWGTQLTNAQGNVTLSGDAKGVAPDVEAFMKDVGTGGETWSGVMTQYCEGIAAGSKTCASSSSHVGYPSGGAFAGLWVDESAPAPSQATGHQIGAEAVSAAGHFGNTTQASNRNTQYVIISPHGTYPDGFDAGANFCAWHDYTGDTTLSGGAVSSNYGQVAFTNLPYIPDAGASCGQNFVNSGSSGTLDGVTIVEGHEYAETITDQFPAGGWTDSIGNENGDKCAWISSGQGASQNVTFGSGTFAVQSTWANDYNGGAGGCEVSHQIVGATCSARQLLANPGFETGSASPWTASAGVVRSSSTAEPADSGSYLAGLDGYGTSHTDNLRQTVTLPTGCSSYTFSFWLHVDTAETTTTTAHDKLTVQVRDSAGNLLATLATYSNLNAAAGYTQHSFNLSAYAGQTVRLKFTGTENASLQTTFAVDDTALNVS